MIKLLNTSSTEWNNLLYNMPNKYKDIYYTSEYYNMYEKNGEGIGKCFVYSEGDKIAMYPFLINKIENYDLDKEYFDIETAYGYGGPIINNFDLTFLNNFENTFLQFCKEKNIIAEFVRFHPLIRNEKIFNSSIDVLHNRITVQLDLEKGINNIWNEEFKSENRNRIRKAEKNGLKVIVGKDYNIFKNIYVKTMDKVNAQDQYYFKDEYYNKMAINNDFILLYVLKGDTVIAAGIFMKYGEYFHYHLGGSLKEHLSLAPNNIMMWESIKIACKSGCKVFHFGGGLKNSKDDQLFRFKSKFSKDIANFYIGKRIHNIDVYNYLITEWEKKNKRKAELFLQYKI